MTQRVVVDQLLPIARDDVDAGAPARAGGRRVADRLPVRAVAAGDLRPAAAALRRGAGLPRAARVERGVLRRADDGDGHGDEELRRHDRQPDAVHEQGAAGGDHARDHRSRVGRARRSRRPGRAGSATDMATCRPTKQQVGKIVQVIGPVVDVEFEAGHLPEIYNALRIQCGRRKEAGEIDVIAEVEQHLGENRVRAVAMKPTDGMQRGMSAERSRRADLGAGRPGDARPRAERARRAGRLSGSAGRSRRSAGRFTARRRRSRTSRPSSRCSRPASRSSTCSSRTCRAARSACSAAPASARPSSSWS